MHLEQIPVSNHPQFFKVKAMRHNYQKNIYPEENFIDKEYQRDLAGSVFLIINAKKAIGTFRLVPIGKGLALADRVSDLEDLMPIAESWEIQRFIIAPKFRALHSTMNIYREIARYLKKHTTALHIVAVCKKRITKLVIRAGLNALAEDIELDGIISNYSLLFASIDDIFDKLNLN